MGHTFQGIQHNTIYPQPNFAATHNENGGWTATQSFYLTKRTWNNGNWRSLFARGNSIVILDPDTEPYHTFLRIASANPIYEEGGLVKVDVSFAGAQFAQYNGDELFSSQTTYRLAGSISDAPLSEHPKWKALTEAEKVTLGRMIDGSVVYRSAGPFGAGIYWNSETGSLIPASENVISADGIQFRNLIAQGQVTYRFPSVTWTETSEGTSPMTSSQINKLGRISNPRGNPPEAAGSRNWMLVSASQEQRGDLYQTELSWELSDKDGHNSFLYDD